MKKRKKIKIKKISLPLKKMTDKEKDYVAVVAEVINHNLKVLISETKEYLKLSY